MVRSELPVLLVFPEAPVPAVLHDLIGFLSDQRAVKVETKGVEYVDRAHVEADRDKDCKYDQEALDKAFVRSAEPVHRVVEPLFRVVWNCGSFDSCLVARADHNPEPRWPHCRCFWIGPSFDCSLRRRSRRSHRPPSLTPEQIAARIRARPSALRAADPSNKAELAGSPIERSPRRKVRFSEVTELLMEGLRPRCSGPGLSIRTWHGLSSGTSRMRRTEWQRIHEGFP